MSTGDVVVVLGTARLSSTASVDGDFVVIGGTAVAASGATVGGDAVVIGGGLEAPADFKPRGESVVLGSTSLGGRLNAFLPWITRGLLWGRPIVPGLPWVWGVVGIFFVVYLAINLVFDRPVRACAETLADRPLTAFAVGLLVLLLAGPVCALLDGVCHRDRRRAIRVLRACRGWHRRQSRHGAMDRDGRRAPGAGTEETDCSR